jgi:hypothetical protein
MSTKTKMQDAVIVLLLWLIALALLFLVVTKFRLLSRF